MTQCISEATTLSSTFAEDVENYCAAGCLAMEVWLTKLEVHLETVSSTNTLKAVSDRGLSLPAAAYQGGLLLSQGEERKAHFDHFKRRLDLCQAFGIRTLIIAADFATQFDQQSLGRAVASLAQAGQWAMGFGVRLAHGVSRNRCVLFIARYRHLARRTVRRIECRHLPRYLSLLQRTE